MDGIATITVTILLGYLIGSGKLGEIIDVLIQNLKHK